MSVLRVRSELLGFRIIRGKLYVQPFIAQERKLRKSTAAHDACGNLQKDSVGDLETIFRCPLLSCQVVSRNLKDAKYHWNTTHLKEFGELRKSRSELKLSDEDILSEQDVQSVLKLDAFARARRSPLKDMLNFERHLEGRQRNLQVKFDLFKDSCPRKAFKHVVGCFESFLNKADSEPETIAYREMARLFVPVEVALMLPSLLDETSEKIYRKWLFALYKNGGLKKNSFHFYSAEWMSFLNAAWVWSYLYGIVDEIVILNDFFFTPEYKGVRSRQGKSQSTLTSIPIFFEQPTRPMIAIPGWHGKTFKREELKKDACTVRAWTLDECVAQECLLLGAQLYSEIYKPVFSVGLVQSLFMYENGQSSTFFSDMVYDFPKIMDSIKEAWPVKRRELLVTKYVVSETELAKRRKGHTYVDKIHSSLSNYHMPDEIVPHLTEYTLDEHEGECELDADPSTRIDFDTPYCSEESVAPHYDPIPGIIIVYKEPLSRYHQDLRNKGLLDSPEVPSNYNSKRVLEDFSGRDPAHSFEDSSKHRLAYNLDETERNLENDRDGSLGESLETHSVQGLGNICGADVVDISREDEDRSPSHGRAMAANAAGRREESDDAFRDDDSLHSLEASEETEETGMTDDEGFENGFSEENMEDAEAKTYRPGMLRSQTSKNDIDPDILRSLREYGERNDYIKYDVTVDEQVESQVLRMALKMFQVFEKKVHGHLTEGLIFDRVLRKMRKAPRITITEARNCKSKCFPMYGYYGRSLGRVINLALESVLHDDLNDLIFNRNNREKSPWLQKPEDVQDAIRFLLGPEASVHLIMKNHRLNYMEAFQIWKDSADYGKFITDEDYNEIIRTSTASKPDDSVPDHASDDSD